MIHESIRSRKQTADLVWSMRQGKAGIGIVAAGDSSGAHFLGLKRRKWRGEDVKPGMMRDCHLKDLSQWHIKSPGAREVMSLCAS